MRAVQSIEFDFIFSEACVTRWRPVGGSAAVRPLDSIGIEEEEDEEVSEEARTAVKMPDPRKPSQREIDEHELTHLPFRSWCEHCVKGKGKEAAHYRDETELTVPEVHVDFAFPGDGKGETLVMLVAKERLTRMLLAMVMPRKSEGEFARKRIGAFFKEIGCEEGHVIVKSDQEPTTKKLLEDLVAQRGRVPGTRTITEYSPVGSSASNGVVERGIQSVEQQVRVMRSALEARWKVKLNVYSAIWPWLVEYAAVILNRMEVGKDGKTAYERLKGKLAKAYGFEFGEAALWKSKAGGGALGKLECMWKRGVFLGVKTLSGEFIV